MADADNARCLKYWDNATAANHSGNDVPVIRYADILLTKAEALNELNGPTQESLDLINEVREPCGHRRPYAGRRDRQGCIPRPDSPRAWMGVRGRRKEKRRSVASWQVHFTGPGAGCD